MNCLFILQHSPYGSSLAREALDMALAFAAFDHKVDVLFSGDGVLQLLPQQDSSPLQQKNIGKTLAALAMYDINNVYASDSALARRGLAAAQLAIAVTAVDDDAIRQLINKADKLVSL